MADLLLIVTGKLLVLENETEVNSGEYNATNCVFTFDEAWDGCTKTVVFYSDPAHKKYVVLTSDTCSIPWEALLITGTLYIGLFGVKADEIIPTNYVTHIITEGAATGITPLPTEDVYLQIVNIMTQQGVDAQTATQKASEAAASASAAATSETNAHTSEVNSKASENAVVLAKQGVDTMYNDIIGNYDTSLLAHVVAEHTSQLAQNATYIDKNTPKLINEKISNLFRQAKDGLAEVTYIMVGDSTRASNGAYIYGMVSPVLQALNVNTILQAQSGLKAEHWGASVTTIQPGYPQAADLITKIPGTGLTTIIDICLGFNDNVHTVAEIKSYIKAGIDLIKASKPDVLFNLTSPNIRNSTEFYKLPIVYSELTTENAYGYINVAENVWKAWADTTGYFIDADHPNEFGQKKIGEYILSKIVPDDLRLSYLSNIPVPKGYLAEISVNDVIRASGFRIEVIYTSGASTGVLYLRKLSDNRWYLFDALTGDSVTGAIEMKNGQQMKIGGGFIARKINALITIKDYTVLDNVANGTTYYPLANFLVTDFTKNKSLNKSVFELIEKFYDIENPYVIRKGYLSTNSINDVIRDSGIRVEVVYTAGTPTGNLYLNKGINGKWSIFESTSGASLSSAIVDSTTILEGEYNVTNGYVSGKTVSAKVFIENASTLNAVAGSASTFYPITNGIVTEFRIAKSTKEHIQNLYDLLNI